MTKPMTLWLTLDGIFFLATWYADPSFKKDMTCDHDKGQSHNRYLLKSYPTLPPYHNNSNQYLLNCAPDTFQHTLRSHFVEK